MIETAPITSAKIDVLIENIRDKIETDGTCAGGSGEGRRRVRRLRLANHQPLATRSSAKSRPGFAARSHARTRHDCRCRRRVKLAVDRHEKARQDQKENRFPEKLWRRKLEDQPHDDPTEPTPIPLRRRESWKGIHGCAQIGDEEWWCRCKRILVRRASEHGAWRDLTDDDLIQLHASGFIATDVLHRMHLRILK